MALKVTTRNVVRKQVAFQKDNSNRENQSSSTGNMRFAAAVPAEADYFDERGIYKEYRPTMMQQQIGSMNILSISDTLLPRENTNSSSKAFRDTGLALKTVQNGSSHEELRETDVSAVSSKHPQSTRDPTTISIAGNSNFRKSTTGTKADNSPDNSTALPVETSVYFRYRD